MRDGPFRRWLGPAEPSDQAPEALATVRPENHGAIGDGATDDTAAFNAAIDALNRLDAGHLELRPGGTYLIARSLDPVSCPVVQVSGAAAIKVADRAIANDDELYSAQVTLLDFRGPRWIKLKELELESNSNSNSNSTAIGKTRTIRRAAVRSISAPVATGIGTTRWCASRPGMSTPRLRA